MITLFIQNEDVATFEDTEISFSFENPVFYLDEISLSRTSNFELPVSPNNNIFNFNLRPEFDGVRRKIDAEMRYDGGHIFGKLYVIDYRNDGDTSVYTCCFVYGELVGLKKVKELGELGDYVNTDLSLSCYNTKLTMGGQTDGNFQNNLSWMWYNNPVAFATIFNGYVNYSPCVKLRYLIDIATPSGVTVDYGTTQPDRFGIILSSNNAVTAQTSFSVSGTLADTVLTGGGGVLELIDGKIKRRIYFSMYITEEIKMIRAIVDCKIHFKKDTSLIILKAKSNEDLTKYVCNRDFLSVGKEDLPNVQNLYEDQNIDFVAGEAFVIAPASSWIHIYGGTFNEHVTSDLISGAFTYEADPPEDMQLTTGSQGTFSLQNNLPDVSLLDLLKTLASLTRTGLRYDDATSTFSFFDYDFSPFPSTDITRSLIKIIQLERTCCEYAQKNIVECDSEDYVDEKSKFKIIRCVVNDYIDEEKTIFKIPFSEGVCKKIGNLKLCYINDWAANSNGDGYDNNSGKSTIVMANSLSSGYCGCLHINTLNPISVKSNDKLTFIMGEGVMITISMRMILFDFMQINYNTVYTYEGQKYVVYSGDYSAGIAELKLQKLP